MRRSQLGVHSDRQWCMFQEHSKDSYLQPQGVYPAHSLPGGAVNLSPHHKWLASGGADGRLSVRAIGALVGQLCDVHTQVVAGILDVFAKFLMFPFEHKAVKRELAVCITITMFD